MFEFLVSNAWAQAAEGSPALNPIISFLPFILIFVVFYFLLIRPQMRQKKERQHLIDSLKRGDRILTQGGFYATVVNVNVGVVEVKLNEETKVKIQRSAVAEILPQQSDVKELDTTPFSK